MLYTLPSQTSQVLSLCPSRKSVHRFRFLSQFLHHLRQRGNLFLQLPNLHGAGISIDIRRALLDFFLPIVVKIKINVLSHIPPFLGVVLVLLSVTTVPLDLSGLAGLKPSSDYKERRVNNTHHDVVKLGVVLSRKPPFEWSYKTQYFDQVQGLRSGN